MAVASPVLERNADTEEKEYTREYRDTYLSEEERHNSRISENYARLINPESRTKDILPARSEEKEAAAEQVQSNSSAREILFQRPYLVENARADAEIFRADSSVNRKLFSAETEVSESLSDEEENEDLRPTQTTIQYKTAGVVRTVEEGKIETRPSQTKRSALTKKDRIIIAVALSVIVALFILIIVNSAVISNLNREVGALQSNLTRAETEYNEALAETEDFKSNWYQEVEDFANKNGMILG